MIPAGAVALPLAELERALELACGVALSPGVRQTLSDAFLRAAREAGQAPEPFLRRVLGAEPRAVSLLVEHAVVGETYFFRHPEQLTALAEVLLRPRPLERPLAIWSAGCATGEEPYTLAMMLAEAGRRGAGDRILATDVSARALEAARLGQYGEWSMRRLEPGLRARYFRPAGRRLAVAAEVRAAVDWRRHNLVTEPAPGANFDLVMCRNVLIYFSPATAALVLAKLVDAVRPGGWLVVGPVETPLLAGLPVERHEAPGATLLRRPERRAQARPPPPTPARRWEDRPRAAPPPPAVGPLPAPEPCCGRDGSAECRAGYGEAHRAARAGLLEAAEALAWQVAERHLCPEAYLLLAMTAEARGDDAGAADLVRRALYLEPSLAQAHAALVPIFGRLGRPEEAARARRNALDALEGLDDGVALRGVEPITAGALRLALAGGAPPPTHSTEPGRLG